MVYRGVILVINSVQRETVLTKYLGRKGLITIIRSRCIKILPFQPPRVPPLEFFYVKTVVTAPSLNSFKNRLDNGPHTDGS